jgi:hypothetical protein
VVIVLFLIFDVPDLFHPKVEVIGWRAPAELGMQKMGLEPIRPEVILA